MTTSTNSTCFNITGEMIPQTSSVYSRELDLSRNSLKHIYSILSYGQLDENWDSYGANRPSQAAIVKAISFITQKLSLKRIEVFFTTPTPDGDILVEVKDGSCNLEFTFSENEADRVVGSCGGDFYMEHTLNETTLSSCLKWLYKKY